MEDFIPTRGAKHKECAEKIHKITTYEAHKKSSNAPAVHKGKNNNFPDERKKQDDSDEQVDIDTEPVSERRKQEIEMKRYRYDVIKLGMSGFAKHKAKQAKIELAISLGAKPPKNRRRNYKKLIEERKQQKARKIKKEKFASGFNSSQLTIKNRKNDKTKSNYKNNKESSGILGVYGKVTSNKKQTKKGGKVQKRKS